jgi:hypothetical protein
MPRDPLLNKSAHSLRQRWLVVGLATFATTVLMVDPAMAEALGPVLKMGEIIRDTVVGLALILLTTAWCIAGYKMIFNGANFRDVTGNLIGGALAGGAGALAAVFISA